MNRPVAILFLSARHPDNDRVKLNFPDLSGEEDRKRFKISAGIVWLAAVGEVCVKRPTAIHVHVQKVKAATEDNAQPICEGLADEATVAPSSLYLIDGHNLRIALPSATKLEITSGARHIYLALYPEFI